MNKQTQPMTREAELRKELKQKYQQGKQAGQRIRSDKLLTENNILKERIREMEYVNVKMLKDWKDQGITETNSKWKQAIQETLKELKDKSFVCDKSFMFDNERKIVISVEELDTTFKQNFGGLVE